jgi:hypothetical protein
MDQRNKLLGSDKGCLFCENDFVCSLNMEVAIIN